MWLVSNRVLPRSFSWLRTEHGIPNDKQNKLAWTILKSSQKFKTHGIARVEHVAAEFAELSEGLFKFLKNPPPLSTETSTLPATKLNLFQF